MNFDRLHLGSNWFHFLKMIFLVVNLASLLPKIVTADGKLLLGYLLTSDKFPCDLCGFASTSVTLWDVMYCLITCYIHLADNLSSGERGRIGIHLWLYKPRTKSTFTEYFKNVPWYSPPLNSWQQTNMDFAVYPHITKRASSHYCTVINYHKDHNSNVKILQKGTDWEMNTKLNNLFLKSMPTKV